MTAHPTIGIISPGDMGHALGAVLVQHGLRVLTNLQGRSPRTVALAAQAGMLDVGDDTTLVREADILLSVLVPAQALALAERLAAAVRATRSELLFADYNAVSPRTIKAIECLLSEAGAEVVDVGIIGAPPRAGRAETRLYASGLGAERLAILGEYGLDVRVIACHPKPSAGWARWRRSHAPSPTRGCLPRCWRERRPSTGWWSGRSWARRRRRSGTGGRPWRRLWVSWPTPQTGTGGDKDKAVRGEPHLPGYRVPGLIRQHAAHTSRRL